MRLKIKARYIVITIILILVFLVYRQFTSQSMGGLQGMGGGAKPPVLVETTHVQSQPLVDVLHSTGTLVGINGVDIKTEVAGRITKIFFKAGSFVKKGKPLIEINPDILKAQYHQAVAQYNLSKVTYQRYKKLYDDQVIALQDFDQTLSNLRVNKAIMEQFKAQLDQMTVYAPLSGRVGLSEVNVGDYVQPGDMLTNMQKLDWLRVDFQMPEIYISQLKLGLPVILKTEAYPKIDFKGKIYEIDTKMDAQTRSVTARAHLLNTKQLLLPGMFIEVYLDLPQNKNILMLPNIAVAYDAQGTYVYRVNHQTVKRIPIKIGHIQGENTEILQGVQVGDEVVLSGQMKLQDGSKINVTK